jgi:hypothetical protein
MAIYGNHSGTAIIREGFGGATGMRQIGLLDLKVWQNRLVLPEIHKKKFHIFSRRFIIYARCV